MTMLDRETMRAYRASLRQSHRAAGMCRDCPRFVLSGQTRCPEHAAYARAQSKAANARNVARRRAARAAVRGH
jgi:sRNA-binding protein